MRKIFFSFYQCSGYTEERAKTELEKVRELRWEGKRKEKGMREKRENEEEMGRG